MGRHGCDLRRPDPLPPDAERRIAQFTELVATSIAKLEARSELDRVLAEQAALRRVATLVARETPPEAIFAAVAREVGDVLGVDATHLGRFDPDGTVVSLAQWGRYPASRSARGIHSRATARPRGCCKRVGPHGWTITRTPGSSRRRCGRSASAPPSESPSPSRAGHGA